MDITEIGAFSEDGVRYYPNHDDAHAKIARLRHLQGLPQLDADEIAEVETIEGWLAEEALYLELEPLSSEDYQKMRAKSPHLRKGLQLQQGKNGPVIDGSSFETRHDAFVEDLLRSRVKRVGNCRAKTGPQEWRAITTIDELLATLKRSDRATRALLEDVHEALISISHLEAGLKN